MAKNKFLDINGVSNLVEKFLNVFSKIGHQHVSNDITDLNTKVLTIDGGASATLSDIFGSAPYVIEFTNEEDEIPVASNEIQYNNGASGLRSTDVQGAIDELKVLATTASSGTDYETFRMRNVAILSELPTTMNDGDIVLIYKP